MTRHSSGKKTPDVGAPALDALSTEGTPTRPSPADSAIMAESVDAITNQINARNGLLSSSAPPKASSISRRAFCGRILTGGVTAGLLSAGLMENVRHGIAQEPTPFQLRYCLASSMYGELPLTTVLGEVRLSGASTIDLWPRKHGSQREQVEELGHDAFARLLKEQDTTLAMTTRYDLGPFRLQEEMDFVKKFGGKLVVTGAVRATDQPTRVQVEGFIRRLQPHIDAAAERGITLGIENHANAVLESPEALRHFAKLIDSPHVGIALAPYHLPQDPQLIAGLIRDIGPRLVHFYAWEHGDGSKGALTREQQLKQLPGRGPLDFRPILTALKEIQYSGWTQILMHPIPRGIPILDTASEVTAAINQSRAYLDAQLT